jgi:thiamine transporter
MSVRDIAEEGMLIALAFILNLIRLFKAPTGGSVNLQMLPLFILAIRHGPTHGFISAGIVYALLSFATDGYPIQCLPFDYIIGFGGVAVLGAFRPLIFNKNVMNEEDSKTKGVVLGLSMILIGGILATGIRFIGSTISSVVGPWGLDWKAAMLYNSIYIPASGGLATVLTMALYPALIQLERRFPLNHGYLI